MPVTATGVADQAPGLGATGTVASPSWPFEFEPQHATAPVFVSAHACASPAASAETLETPSALTGVRRVVVLPSASWPRSLRPQQRSPAVLDNAHA